MLSSALIVLISFEILLYLADNVGSSFIVELFTTFLAALALTLFVTESTAVLVLP